MWPSFRGPPPIQFTLPTREDVQTMWAQMRASASLLPTWSEIATFLHSNWVWLLAALLIGLALALLNRWHARKVAVAIANPAAILYRDGVLQPAGQAAEFLTIARRYVAVTHPKMPSTFTVYWSNQGIHDEDTSDIVTNDPWNANAVQHSSTSWNVAVNPTMQLEAVQLYLNTNKPSTLCLLFHFGWQIRVEIPLPIK